jgi:uncharacterized protein YjbJ (UPF0337 family)
LPQESAKVYYSDRRETMADRGDKARAKAKEYGGKAVGDEELESEGRTEATAEDTKQTLEEARDKISGAAEGLKEKFSKDDEKE